jgi:hypothetical protein
MRSGLHVDSFQGEEYTTPPSFNESGTQFLVVSRGSELRSYSFPDGTLIAKMDFSRLAEDEQIGDLVSFAGSTNALTSSLSGRLYSVCLSRMAIEDELCLIGHEPKPVPKLYPGLPNESGFCSDLSFFLQLPSGEFLSFHHELPSSSNDPWIDRALTWRFPG